MLWHISLVAFGLVAGSIVTLIVMSCCVVAKKADEEMERLVKNEPDR